MKVGKEQTLPQVIACLTNCSQGGTSRRPRQNYLPSPAHEKRVVLPRESNENEKKSVLSRVERGPRPPVLLMCSDWLHITLKS